jgi:hypothetical protein
MILVVMIVASNNCRMQNVLNTERTQNPNPRNSFCYNQQRPVVSFHTRAEVVELADTPSKSINYVFSVTSAE